MLTNHLDAYHGLGRLAEALQVPVWQRRDAQSSVDAVDLALALRGHGAMIRVELDFAA